jgi:hypothetical protein
LGSLISLGIEKGVDCPGNDARAVTGHVKALDRGGWRKAMRESEAKAAVVARESRPSGLCALLRQPRGFRTGKVELAGDTFNSDLACSLIESATRGEPGDATHRRFENRAFLEAFSQVSAEAASCIFVLDGIHSDASSALAFIDGQPLRRTTSSVARTVLGVPVQLACSNRRP